MDGDEEPAPDLKKRPAAKAKQTPKRKKEDDSELTALGQCRGNDDEDKDEEEGGTEGKEKEKKHHGKKHAKKDKEKKKKEKETKRRGIVPSFHESSIQVKGS